MVTDRRGTLSLERGALVFAADDGERLTIPVEQIARSRRLRATPVLEVRYGRDGDERVALFFFAEPPPHPDLEGDPGPPIAGRLAWRGRRAREIVRLRGANRRLKTEIEAWAEATGRG